MKDKFNLGIEISDNVSRSAFPHEIKRYDIVENKKVMLKPKEAKKDAFYRYRPGINSFMTRDIDV